MAKTEYTTLEAAGREVRLSNPAKVFFPEPGWTKLDVAQYYLDVADAALIHLRGRPGTMKRFVDGVAKEQSRSSRSGSPRTSRIGCTPQR